MASQVRRLKKRTGIAAVVALCAAVSFTIPTALPTAWLPPRRQVLGLPWETCPWPDRIRRAYFLANGEVLVAGGQDANGNALSSAELYNPATHAWTPTGSMHTARYLAGATRLPDGRVLVAGGLESDDGNLSSAEIYDPNTGVWSVTGSMNQPRNRVATVLLNNGQVLAVGGLGGPGQRRPQLGRAVQPGDGAVDLHGIDGGREGGGLRHGRALRWGCSRGGRRDLLCISIVSWSRAISPRYGRLDNCRFDDNATPISPGSKARRR